MKIRLVLRPGVRGTRKLWTRYGKRLVCVRYRYDERLGRRYKTVELIVDEVEWKPRPPRRAKLVGVRLLDEESFLRDLILESGGRWYEKEKVWILRKEQAIALGLRQRIVPSKSI